MTKRLQLAMRLQAKFDEITDEILLYTTEFNAFMNKPPLLYEGRAFEDWTYLDVCNTLKVFYPQEVNQEGKPQLMKL